MERAARLNKLGNETCSHVEVVSLPQNYDLPSVPSHKRYITTIAADLRRRVTNL